MSHTDPFDAGALLSAAVVARRSQTGESEADVARLAKIDPANLWRALRNPNARPETVRRVCRALGLRVALVKDGHGAR